MTLTFNLWSPKWVHRWVQSEPSRWDNALARLKESCSKGSGSETKRGPVAVVKLSCAASLVRLVTAVRRCPSLREPSGWWRRWWTRCRGKTRRWRNPATPPIETRLPPWSKKTQNSRCYILHLTHCTHLEKFLNISGLLLKAYSCFYDSFCLFLFVFRPTMKNSRVKVKLSWIPSLNRKLKGWRK